MEPYPPHDVHRFDQALETNKRQVIKGASAVRDRVDKVGTLRAVREMYDEIRQGGSTTQYDRDTQLITAMVMISEVLIWVGSDQDQDETTPNNGNG